MNFKGNKKQISQLTSWLSDYLDNKSIEKYYILTSDYNGNGLTTISKELADTFNLEFTEITSLDITSKDDLSKIQGLMLSMSLKQKKRLIVFDEITEIKYKKDIFKLIEISKNPVLLTTTSLYKLPKQYRKNVIKIYKPSLSEMIEILKDKTKEYDLTLSNSDFLEIIKSSPSVGTAINALYSKSASDMTGTSSYYTNYYNFLNGRDVEIDNIFLYWLIDNVEAVKDDRFIKYLKLIYSMLDMNDRIKLNQTEIKGSVILSNQPSYPIYFQYRAGSIRHFNNLSIFLGKLGTLLHLSKREVLNDALPILKELASDNDWIQTQIRELGLSKEEIRMLGIKYIKKKTKQTLDNVKHKKEISLSGYF